MHALKWHHFYLKSITENASLQGQSQRPFLHSVRKNSWIFQQRFYKNFEQCKGLNLCFVWIPGCDGGDQKCNVDQVKKEFLSNMMHMSNMKRLSNMMHMSNMKCLSNMMHMSNMKRLSNMIYMSNMMCMSNMMYMSNMMNMSNMMYSTCRIWCFCRIWCICRIDSHFEYDAHVKYIKTVYLPVNYIFHSLHFPTL